MPDSPHAARRRITAFSGLKVFAVASIIACHMGNFPDWDFCARMVEVLFLLAGFCMAYNHFGQKPDNALAAGAEIVRRKLPRLYPVHLITFLLQLFFVAAWAGKPLEYILSFGLLNLSLQHAWFAETQFMFNNVSWFLSALVFCYFITPALSGFAQAAKARRRLWLMFWLLAAVRLYLEYMVVNHPRFISLDLHANPLVQSLNYSLGFIAGIWFIDNSPLNDVLRRRLSPATFGWLEVLFVALYLAGCYALKGEAYRLFFILLALPPVYLLAFGRGTASRLLSFKPLRWLETLNLEIFMFHSFILYHYPVNRGDQWYSVKFAALVFTVALAYHAVYSAVRRRLSR